MTRPEKRYKNFFYQLKKYRKILELLILFHFPKNKRILCALTQEICKKLFFQHLSLKSDGTARKATQKFCVQLKKYRKILKLLILFHFQKKEDFMRCNPENLQKTLFPTFIAKIRWHGPEKRHKSFVFNSKSTVKFKNYLFCFIFQKTMRIL